MTAFLLFAGFIASMLVVAHIAQSQGRRMTPWIWTAAIIGPLAIPILYLVPRGSSAGPKDAKAKGARPK